MTLYDFVLAPRRNIAAFSASMAFFSDSTVLYPIAVNISTVALSGLGCAPIASRVSHSWMNPSWYRLTLCQCGWLYA